MPEIQIFKFKNNQLRSMIDAHGEPWFVAKEMCIRDSCSGLAKRNPKAGHVW